MLFYVTQFSMFKLRLVLVFLATLLLFSMCLLWSFVAEEERMTKLYFSKYELEFKTTKKELQFIKNGFESIRNEVVELKRRQRSRVYYRKRTKILPKWIEHFAAPHWSEFQPWRGVFVFFVSYRHGYLRKCLQSIAFASADIDKTSVCVFALDRTPITTDSEVNQTMEVIRNVTFCKVVVWKVEREAEKSHEQKKNYALRLKRHWWFVLESVFNATLTGMYVSWWSLLILSFMFYQNGQ
jgi:hypothetical protein